MENPQRSTTGIYPVTKQFKIKRVFYLPAIGQISGYYIHTNKSGRCLILTAYIISYAFSFKNLSKTKIAYIELDTKFCLYSGSNKFLPATNEFTDLYRQSHISSGCSIKYDKLLVLPSHKANILPIKKNI